MTDEMASQTRTNNGTDSALPDIVERLVTLATCGAFGRGDAEVMLTAADEIVRLRALITEWAETMGDKADSFGGLVRYENARDALREEANR